MSRAQCIAPHGINRDFIRRNALRPTIRTTNWRYREFCGRLRCANRPYKITIFLWMEGFNKTPSEFFYGWKGSIKHHLNFFMDGRVQ